MVSCIIISKFRQCAYQQKHTRPPITKRPNYQSHLICPFLQIIKAFQLIHTVHSYCVIICYGATCPCNEHDVPYYSSASDTNDHNALRTRIDTADPDLLDMDNKTLIDEYEAGRLTDRIQLSASCDADILAEQYAKMHNIYLKEQIEIVDPEEENFELFLRSSSLIACSTWYGFYADENGDIQYQIIHKREATEDFYTDNDSVNEIYDWLREVLQEIYPYVGK